MSARDRIRAFLENNVGRIVTTHEIRKIAGISDYPRRIRELRDQEGMQIRSHRDRPDLKPGQYILESLERTPAISKGISPQLRSEILERNGYTCRHCGRGPGDKDPFYPNRKVILHIDHEKPLSQGGTNNRENLRVLCSACNETRSNIESASESAINILARIRRQSNSVQIEIYKRLREKFGNIE
ncbi:MAG: HNH endonuclease [candidate division Zixibacteria bacterium]|nr:HNH endonuclease [candidate division Zixibacteria bacterium]